MKKTYENALRLLDSRRRKGRPKEIAGSGGVPSISEAPGVTGTPNLRGIPSLVGMHEWLYLLGHSNNDVNNINIIHIAGTKGKGSTCAFTRSFLHVHGLRTGFPGKVGLYTSPDLRGIRERIQINNKPVSEALFTQYFFEVWDGLSSQSALTPGHDGKDKMPRFLQLLALIAFHTFIRERTDVAIFETHHGGEYDATNVIPKPAVTGITAIALDHVAQLGPTIENVAWHKSGIFKHGVPAFSSSQDPAVISVFQARAKEKEVPLKFVEVDQSLPKDAWALHAPVQRINCSLALAIAEAFLELKAPAESRSLTPEDIAQGIERFNWPGRYETIVEGNNHWFLDGAHNELSVKHVAEWFAKTALDGSKSSPYVLIFTHISEERDCNALMECLAHSLRENGIRPRYIIFTTYQERLDGNTRIDKTLKSLLSPPPDVLTMYSEGWKKIDPQAEIITENAIEGALHAARKIGEKEGGMRTLITGSLHLVGGVLNLLRPLE
ncbi:putative tetrahydrofolylpolyglutamate synthase [Ascodesmis nigricans]|uniref:Folylpolyglutamate synthase n=1 Tax=Ascodesmis nigricans TaxID=341454 RepID=A0A4S2MRL1_9PEZI|nr:putative tetrahydrofolylpolyglutamate synthase [Ascodesmis nigricans]